MRIQGEIFSFDGCPWLDFTREDMELLSQNGFKVGDKVMITIEKSSEQQQPPTSTEIIKEWEKTEALLQAKDFRGEPWRLAYNAFLEGYAKGAVSHLVR